MNTYDNKHDAKRRAQPCEFGNIIHVDCINYSNFLETRHIIRDFLKGPYNNPMLIFITFVRLGTPHTWVLV